MKFRDKFINLIDLLWEFPCPLCGCDRQHGGSPNSFCSDCLEQLPLLHGKRCPGCGGELEGIFGFCSSCLKMPPRPWINAMSIMKMEGLAEKAIYKLKFSGSTCMARPLTELGAPLLFAPDFANVDMIVPVPLHYTRQLLRSYNQSELLAKMLSRRMHKPCCKVLKKIRPTIRQATLSREERLKNLRGAFAAVSKAQISGKKILLVDDVITTGATLHACAEVLMNNGAEYVTVFTVARR